MAKPRRRVRPADVIEGKTKPGPRALVSLIAEVNPTGRGLTPSEQARRYAEKSALQSLLLRWYGDSFFAERTDDESIVLLRHRHFDECACHSHVSSLDDEARAWVWRNLDDGETRGAERAAREAAPAAKGAAPGNPADLLAQAQAALAAYDYELAERLLVGAFELSCGEASASRALLELFVDVLGQDARALALEPHLSAEARTDPPVRSLIGLAAARTGDATRALTIARDLAHPRAGEVCAEAGRAALRSGDVEQARDCAAHARSLGASPEAASLEVAIEEALRDRARAEEARLEALVAAGDDRAAEALARELLGAGLPSTSAQRVLREAAARRADAAQRELSMQARAALDDGDWAAARRALEELARLGRRDDELEASLDEAQRAAKAAADAATVDDVLDALSREPADGLARYLALSDALRARVRSSAPAAPCERAELVREALKTRRIEHIVAAVLRIGELEVALEEDELEVALAAAEALPRSLHDAPPARDLVERLLATITARRADEVHAQLGAAYDAILGADWDGALRLLRALTPAELAAVPDAASAVTAMTGAASLARELGARVARACEPDADPAALHTGRRAATALSELIPQLAASGPSAGSDEVQALARGWEEEAERLRGALSAALRFEEHAVPEGTLVDLEDEQGLGARAPDVRLAGDDTAWFIAAPEERCYLTEATLPDLVVTRRFSFSPGGLRRGQGVTPIGDTLWIPLSDGGMVVLDRQAPGTVIDVWWGPATDEKNARGLDGWSVIAPDGTAVVRPSGKQHVLQLRSLTSDATRPLHHCAGVAFFGRPGRVRALVTGGRRRSWYLVDASDLTPFGGPDRFPGELADFVPIAAIEDPTSPDDDAEGGHIFLAVDAASLDGKPNAAPDHGALHLVRVTADLKPVQHTLVSPKCRSLQAWLYAVDQHILVVHREGASPVFELFDGSTLESIGAMQGVPGLTVPVQDVWGRELLFLERTHIAFRCASAPTRLGEEEMSTVSAIPFLSDRLSPHSSCGCAPEAWAQSLYADQLDPGLLKAVSARTDRARLVTIAQASGFMHTFTDRILARTTPSLVLKLLWRAPDGPGGARGFLHGAEHAVTLCPGHPEVVARLEASIELFKDEQGASDHALHLLGLAHLATGRREAALATWRRGLALRGDLCPFFLLIAVAGGLSEEERARGLNDLPFPPFVHDHAARYEDAVRAMVRLDAALEEGLGGDGWEQAHRVRALVGPSWQLSARVARLHLEHPDPATDPWRYQLDLAWMASGAWLGPTRNHMIFAGCHWDYRRFTEIAKRAGAVLDAMGIGPAERVDVEELDARALRQSEPPEDEAS